MYFDLSIHNFVHESLFHKETNKFSSGNKQLFHPRPLMKNKYSQKKKKKKIKRVITNFQCILQKKLQTFNLSVRLTTLIFVNLFLLLFMVPVHFLVLFIGPTVLFQTFSKKNLVSTK